MNLGTALVAVRADMKDLKKDLDKTRKEFDGHTAKLQKQADRSKEGFKKMWLVYTAGAAAALLAANRLISIGKRLIDDYEDQRKAVAGMETALRSMGRYTPELSHDLQQYAEALQQVTNFGDEATLQGIKFLATYRDITDNLMPRSIAVMQDLAALMGGGPQGLVRAANMLGKASMGMTGELRRVGITVDQATFAAEGYQGVLAQIAMQVEGQARAMADPWTQLSNVIGDTRENMGALISVAFEDWAKDITKLVGGMSEAFNTLQKRVNETRRIFIEAQIRMYEAALETGQLMMDLPGTMAPDFPLGLNADDIERITSRLKELRQELAGVTSQIQGDAAGGGAAGGGEPPIGAADFWMERARRIDEAIDYENERFQEQLAYKAEAEAEYWLNRARMIDEAIDYEVEKREEAATREAELARLRASWEENVQRAKMVAIGSWLNVAVTALQTFGSQSKAATVAAIAVQAAFAMFTTFASTQAAAMRALAELGPIAGAPVAAAIEAAGAWKMAAIGAAAAVQGAAVLAQPSGGGPATVPTARGEALLTSSAADVGMQRGGLTIIIEGDVLADEYYIERIAEKISEAVEDRDVRLIATEARF